jgi:hypothetical protein
MPGDVKIGLLLSGIAALVAISACLGIARHKQDNAQRSEQNPSIIDSPGARQTTGISDSPGARQTTLVFQVGNLTVWAIASLAAAGWIRSGWDRTRHRQALDRTIIGVEHCGSDCDAKRHNQMFSSMDPVECLIHRRVKRVSG